LHNFLNQYFALICRELKIWIIPVRQFGVFYKREGAILAHFGLYEKEVEKEGKGS